MTQDEILAIVRAHPEGIMQAELSKTKGLNPRNVVHQICQLYKKRLIRREAIGAKWKIYPV